MNSIIGLPESLKKHDCVWMIVDHLTKSVHLSVSIVSDKDHRFTLGF